MIINSTELMDNLHQRLSANPDFPNEYLGEVYGKRTEMTQEAKCVMDKESMSIILEFAEHENPSEDFESN